jgi:hypothetical protein
MLIFFLIFLGILLVMGGVVLGLYGWRNLRAALLLGRPRSRVANLRPGLCKVRGKIVPLGKILRSPVTNQPCVYYRLRVTEDRAVPRSDFESESGIRIARLIGGFTGVFLFKTAVAIEESNSSSHSLLNESDNIPLLIEDDTGLVEVDLRRATIFAKKKSCLDTNFSHQILALSRLTDKLREEYGIHTVDERGRFKTLHFMEEVLLVGAKVTVVGPVAQLKSGDFCFQQKGDPLLVSEREVGKESQEARSRAIGFIAGSTAALAVGLGCLLSAFVFVVRALLAG